MQTFRRLPPVVLAVFLSAGFLLTCVGMGRLVGAQDVPPPKKGAATPAGSAQAQKSEEDPQAADLLRQARTRLAEYASVKADLKETVFIGDRRTSSDGTYVSGAFPRFRVEYQVRVGGTAGILTEACDGNVVHSKREIRKIDALNESAPGADGEGERKVSFVLGKVPLSEPQYSRCDVQEVAKALASEGRPVNEVLADAGIGGLAAILASLDRSMVFTAVRESKTKAGTYTVLEGVWDPTRLETLTAAFGSGGAALKQLVPERAAVYLDPQTLFPVRIVYLRRVGEGQAVRPILALEFVNVRFNEAVDESSFAFTLPSEIEEKDETSEFIASVKPAAAAAAPGGGLPAELLPGTPAPKAPAPR